MENEMGRWQARYWLFKLGHLHRPLIYLYSFKYPHICMFIYFPISWRAILLILFYETKRKIHFKFYWKLFAPPPYRGLHIYNVWYRNGNTAQFTFMNILERYSSVCFSISFPRLMQYIVNPFILSIKKNDSLHIFSSSTVVHRNKCWYEIEI